MNNHLKGIIARLEVDLTQAEAQVSSTRTRFNAAEQERRNVEKALAEYRHKAIVEERIAGLGIRPDVVELVERTQVRCKQSKHLREGNEAIRGANWRINAFLGNGAYPSFRSGESPRFSEMMILGWCQTIMSNDGAEKSVRLGDQIDFEVRRLRDELSLS